MVFPMMGILLDYTDPEGDAEKISEIVKTRLDPIPEFLLRFYESEDGKRLIILDIYKGDENSILLFRRRCFRSIYPCRK